MKLPLEFYRRASVTQIAKELIGKVIFTFMDGHLTAGIISETEAYAGITDRASHAFNNRRTSRTEVMFANGGVSYIYLCYGMHHLFNFVTNKKDIPDAVLLRGIIPFTGIEIMEMRTGKKNTNINFTNGPGKVSKALGMKVSYNGENLTGEKIWVEDLNTGIDSNIILSGPRIGVEYAGKDALLPYRFYMAGKSIALNKKSPAQC